MIKAGKFVADIASVLRLPTQTVEGTYRNIREAGLLTSGARGVNAPNMTDLDTARMLIALMAAGRVAYSADAVRDFGGLIYNKNTLIARWFAKKNSDEVERRNGKLFNLEDRGLSNVHTLEEAIAEVIRIYGADRYEPYFQESYSHMSTMRVGPPETTLTVQVNNLLAEINMAGNRYSYIAPEMMNRKEHEKLDSKTFDAKRRKYGQSIDRVAGVTSRELTDLAGIIRGWYRPFFTAHIAMEPLVFTVQPNWFEQVIEKYGDTNRTGLEADDAR
jgi:hypothetical protein